MVILVTSKNEEDPIKIEGARVATLQNIGFSNTKGQSDKRTNLAERIKKNRIKMKALVWPQH